MKTSETHADETALRQAILDTLDVGVCLVRSRRIVWANRAHNTMYGCEIGSTGGQPTAELYVRSLDYERIGRESRIRFASGESYSTNVEMRRRDGRTFEAQVVGRVLHPGSGDTGESLWVTTDVTERNQVRATLLESEARYRNLFEENRAVKLLIDPATGEIVEANSAACAFYGYSASQLSRMRITDINTLSEPQVIHEMARATGDARSCFNFRHRLASGELRDVEVYASPVTFGGRSLLISIVHDVTARKEAEARLLESEATLRAVFDSSRDAIGVSNKGVLIFANPEFLRLFGYERGEGLIGTPIVDRVAQSHRHMLARYAQQRAAGEEAPRNYEARGLKADGTEFDAELSVSSYEQGGEVFIVAHVRNVTDRRLEEEERRRTNRWLLATQRISAVGGWYVNLKTGAVWASPEARRIYGTGEGELTLAFIRKFALPEYRPALEQAFRGMVERGERYDIEFRIARGGDGKVVDIHSLAEYDPVENSVLGVVRDMTERKQAEAKLRESEERLRRAVMDSPHPIMIHAEDGEVLMVSESWTAISGYPASEIATTDAWTEKAHAPNIQEARDRIKKLYPLTSKHRNGEVSIRTRSGQERIWDIMSAPMGRLADARRMVISMAVDVTDRKKAEAALKQSEAQFRQAQKMEAIGQLAGGVAHDFNNILAAVMMYLGLLQQDMSADPDARASLKELEKNMLRGAALTRQLLAFSRQQAMDPKVLDLRDLLQGLLKMLRRLLGEQIRISFEAPDGLPTVEADPGMMEQVVMNLCVNARDAMPRGGLLTLKLESVDIGETEAAASPDRRAGRFLKLAVSDEGSGMDEQTLQRIFEPFFTTKGLGKGTGLGLATVHGIVKQHNGWVEVQSTVGTGTTFQVYLPASARTADASDKSEDKKALAGRNEAVLFVEDEESVRSVAKTILVRSGYRPYMAADSSEALSLWEGHRGEIELLITDLVMPGEMDGRELASRLMAEKPSLRVLITSGYSESPPLLGLEASAKIALLRKPFDMAHLLEAARRCLDDR